MTDDIEKRVIAITASTLGVDENKVTVDADFAEDLGADSLDKVELVMALETEFEHDIPDDKAVDITTIKDAIEYIRKQILVTENKA